MSEAEAEGLVAELRARIAAASDYERRYEQAPLAFADAEALLDALEANARALAEAGAEIERLQGLVAGIRECPHELGSVQDDGTCRRCGAAPRNAEGFCATCVDERVAAATSALGPRPCDCARCDCGNIGDAQEVARWDERAAALKTGPALENSKAGLADANQSKPLSQDQEIAGLREEVSK